ncbi:MAG: hypothetical protein FJ039_11075 [Chloroflexi bacterium]|nr:hypothetical protein [Chloroflexota bacterium]
MDTFGGAATAIILISIINMYRLIQGRTLFDRMLALAAIGTNTIILVGLAGFVFSRPEMFVDVALAYALLNFVSIVVISKYLERRKEQ